MKLVTTHDWSTPVDVAHVMQIRHEATAWSAGGPAHLVLEVLAYAVDEAAEGSTASIEVRLQADGSVLVVDDGRGTDSRRDERGAWLVKPIMATRDLRFFEVPTAPVLTDGLRRNGMSVVAALSSWLVHTNERTDGAWTARYERGLPVGPPVSIPTDGRQGTSVHFMPDPQVFGEKPVDAEMLTTAVRRVRTAAGIDVVGA